MRKTILTLMISGLLASGATLAGGQGKDHDAEAKGQAHSQSRLSIGSARTMGSATAFAKVDANGDNIITQSEAEAMQGLPQQFGKLDGNGDGRLTMQEFASLTASSSGDRGRSGDSGRPGAEVAVDAETDIGLGVNAGSERPEDQERGRAKARAEAESETTASLRIEDISRTNAVQAFNNVDADGNFKLDEEEAAKIEGLQKKFADLDKDGDGALDYAEFNAVTNISAEGRRQ